MYIDFYLDFGYSQLLPEEASITTRCIYFIIHFLWPFQSNQQVSNGEVYLLMQTEGRDTVGVAPRGAAKPWNLRGGVGSESSDRVDGGGRQIHRKDV